jgi:hypothetical protein
MMSMFENGNLFVPSFQAITASSVVNSCNNQNPLIYWLSPSSFQKYLETLKVLIDLK